MATITWMWGDASLVGHGAAQINPFRWSSAKSIKATLEDLEGHETQGEQRPVLMWSTDAVSPWESRYQNVADAIEGLKNVTLPHSLSSFNHTDSQAQEEVKLAEVLQRLKDHQKAMRLLKENMSLLIAKIDQEGSSLEDATNMLVDCQKIACTRGEDLLGDMLALNGPAGKFLGDREKRKAALACLNAFLDEVDAVKSDLVAFEKSLNDKLHDAWLVKELIRRRHLNHHRQSKVWRCNLGGEEGPFAEWLRR